MNSGRTDVERLSAGLVISVACHAALIVLVVLGISAEREDLPPPPPAVTIEMVEAPAKQIVQELISEPIAVVVLDDLAITEPKRTPSARTKASAKQKQITTTTTTGSETAITTIETPHTNALGMRKPDRVDLRLPQTMRDSIANAPPGTRPEPPVETTGKLKPSGGGTHKSDEGTFVAHVGKDGTVDIKDGKNLQVGQRPRLRNPKTWIPLVAGSFDITDAVMRKTKNDPYFSKKLKYLDSTRDERVAIGSRYRKQELARSGEHMQKSLAALPADPVARRQALFELWDDCAETGEPAIVEGGRAARAIVFGYIRGRHAKGSAAAFTDNELVAFNKQRRSKTVFSPYD